ncbi:MAG: GIY-YIG nuclease family protein [Gammaproteobacteria bacterium]|nr:MAG: GIY-YIG nuclease family protein [Gammaproteobacteria bacterium]RLA15237.1 MAG: GIY-YIG nuclease family protein [Gammaproteobacteria bacterium]
MTNSSTWFVYIVRCADSSYYTGITTNLERRLGEHNGTGPGTDSGARYTRSRRPVELVYSETSASRSAASKREYAIKRLSQLKKVELVNAGS